MNDILAFMADSKIVFEFGDIALTQQELTVWVIVILAIAFGIWFFTR